MPQPIDITHLNDADGTFSERFPVLFEPEGRLEKADKVIAVLGDYFGERTAQVTVVDIGCSTGIMTRHFAGAFGRVIGLDNDQVGVIHGRQLAAQAGIPSARLQFLAGDGCHMPLAANSVDAVICNQVYEHVDDQDGLMREIHRILKPGGACYFGIGTRHVLIEGHYKLPFLSWVPHPVAHVYMKLAGKNAKYDVRLLSYRNLKKMVRNFGVIDYTIDVIKDADRYADRSRGRLRRFVARWPMGLLRALRPVIPVHVWVLVKPNERCGLQAGQFVCRRCWERV
ncbi:MAG TPA: class I SAM-dependent methyltransferase [bacterium]|nr:class I SAM-dependent methyltransferase [bacterium]